MGSFNVACSASNISISCGDDTVLIPLKAQYSYSERNQNARIADTHMYIYPDDVYAPALLPIRGTYDDYGRIENIIETENTKQLEKYFKTDILSIISLITDGRSTLSSYSSAFEAFDIPTLDNIEISRNELLKYGFEDISENAGTDNTFLNVAANCILSFKVDEKHDNYLYITISNHTGEYKEPITEHIYQNDGMSNIQTLIFNHFSYIIGLSKEKQNLVQHLEKFNGLSAMFVHGEIYDTLVNNTLDGKKKVSLNENSTPTPYFLEKLGFKYKEEGMQNGYPDRTCAIYERDGHIVKIDEYSAEIDKSKSSLYYMKDLFKSWEKTTGVVLDQTLIQDVSSNTVEILKLTEEIKNVPNKSEIIEVIDTIRTKIKNSNTDKDKEKLEEELLEAITLKFEASDSYEMKSKIKRHITMGNADWKIFIAVYTEALKETKNPNRLAIEINNFRTFCSSFWSTNHFYTPSCNGEQCGNYEASQLLYKKALLVTNNTLEDSGEESVVDMYLSNQNMKECKEWFEEVMEEYDTQYHKSFTGLSKFEIELCKKDISVLEDVLKSYI